MWIVSLEAESARLEAIGMPVVVTAGDSDGRVFNFAYRDPGMGSLLLNSVRGRSRSSPTR